MGRIQHRAVLPPTTHHLGTHPKYIDILCHISIFVDQTRTPESLQARGFAFWLVMPFSFFFQPPADYAPALFILFHVLKPTCTPMGRGVSPSWLKAALTDRAGWPLRSKPALFCSMHHACAMKSAHKHRGGGEEGGG